MAYSHLHEDFDPWEDVDDLDGQLHYHVLEVKPQATVEEIKSAYRKLARVYHPDKGGDSTRFAAIQKAWELLSDPVARRTYDDWAKQLKYRYIPGITPKADGGEDILLDEFERLGMSCDARSQLVVLCEVCGRPSTKVCFVCECRFCDFCTRKQHWKGKFGLHWPVVNAPIMRDKLAKQELEKKRIEDAKRLVLEDPNYREEHELNEIRMFKRAAQVAYETPGSQGRYNLRLSKFYGWAQTAQYVYVACFVPTGYTDKELNFQPSANECLLQPEDSPPIIHRYWAYEVDTTKPIETYKTKDNRLFTVALAKGTPGEHWHQVFMGDSAGARCLQQPYKLTESQDEVIMEFELPFWMDKDDVRVDIDEDGVTVEVRNHIKVARSFWKDVSESDKASYRGVVDPPECMWSLDDETDDNGEKIKLLMITLVKPPLTEDEMQWKKHKRMDNRNRKRIDQRNATGVRFFADDEDYFQLEDMLQALCFLEAGETWAPAKPWQVYHHPYATDKWARSVDQLSKGAQQHLEGFLGDESDED